METKRVWKSAVARSLVLQHKKQPAPAPIGDQIIVMSQKGISPAGCAALLAKRLYQSAGSLGNRSPKAVDLKVLCDRVGLGVEYRPLVLDGLLQETDSGYLAVINSIDKPPRQRMSLAHEIGHLALYRETGLTQAFGHISVPERKSIDASEVEQLCDHFASELVMPSDEWQDLIKAEGLSLTTLNQLRELYEVSMTDAAPRLAEVAEIALMESAIIIWKPVLENEVAVAMQPIRNWGKLRLGNRFLKQPLCRSSESVLSGSPFYAWENKTTTAGKISLPMMGSAGKYLAQSDLINSKHIITLLLPERLGWESMFRRPNRNHIAV